GGCKMTISLYMSPEIPVEKVRTVLRDAPLQASVVARTPEPRVFFDGLVGQGGHWVARYIVQYWIDDYANQASSQGMVWDCIMNRLRDSDLPLNAMLGGPGEGGAGEDGA